MDDFGDCDGIVVIGRRDEPRVRASYPRRLPMSTSILAFHRLARDEARRPALILERHGSLHVEDVRELVERHGFGLFVAPTARERLVAGSSPASSIPLSSRENADRKSVRYEPQPL